MQFLNDQERTQLRMQHKRERDKRICDRIKAILLSDEGWKPQQIAKVLLITDQAVRERIDEYRTSCKLKPENEAIGFIDGVHPTHNVQPAFGWIKTGIRKEIPANTGRGRLNLSGMIDVYCAHSSCVNLDRQSLGVQLFFRGLY